MSRRAVGLSVTALVLAAAGCSVLPGQSGYDREIYLFTGHDLPCPFEVLGPVEVRATVADDVANDDRRDPLHAKLIHQVHLHGGDGVVDLAVEDLGEDRYLATGTMIRFTDPGCLEGAQR